MTSIKCSIGLSIGLVILSAAIAGCGLNHADANAVSEAFFRAIMAKDSQQLQQVMESGESVQSGQMWNDGSFIRDQSGRIKDLWTKEAISGYSLGNTIFQDYQGPIFHDYQGLASSTQRLVQIKFVLSGKSFVATFTIQHQGTGWYPVWNRTQSGDFLITFEEP